MAFISCSLWITPSGEANFQIMRKFCREAYMSKFFFWRMPICMSLNNTICVISKIFQRLRNYSSNNNFFKLFSIWKSFKFTEKNCEANLYRELP
jgi:hypothetical protein